ncbi:MULTISPECIES: ABC transporter substrate-binding protein [Bradyrhizobium]|uniref:ABC transporter substrate-binding protein n=1 Tax=Bradyrhizobium TaxID=374 RepID=UPI0004AC8125|nr:MULTISPECIES: ABC transporter substrate-binding protein [unclassified Bradyrhizobium]
MLRRHFFFCGLAVVFGSGAARADKPRVWRLGYLGSGSGTRSIPVLRKALQGLGYEEGKTLLLDIREAKGDYSVLPGLAKDLVAGRPDVIVAEATPAIAAVKEATANIPIVMCPATDPVGSGFIESFAHPGGNITGLANMYGDLTAKTLDFMHLVLPNAKKIAILTSANPTHRSLFEVAKQGAKSIGIAAEQFAAPTPADLPAAFAAMKSAGCEAVYVLADPPRPLVPQLAQQLEMPAIYQVDTYVQVGGLMSYGPDVLDLFVKAASYVDKIFKGTAPADIPVEQPSTFHFKINLRTARALGLKVPETVLIQADQVIE